MRLAQSDFEAVEQSLDRSIRQQLPAEKLQAIWQSLTAQVGAFKEQVGAHTFQTPSAEVVIVTCAFAKASLDINVAFSESLVVTGLTITPVGSIEQQFTAQYEAPAYVKQNMFKEQEVEIGRGEWTLPGTLSLPAGNAPFAAVVLVHGSGPNDRDETIGPNKPFRDLAWGLASQGIAVLRYDKRTKVYAKKMQDLGLSATITVREEVIDDALAAVALLPHCIQELNPQRIFVLGHSLGGYLLPRIGTADAGSVAGLLVNHISTPSTLPKGQKMGGVLRMRRLMNKSPELSIPLQNLAHARALTGIKRDKRTTPLVCIDIHKNWQIPLRKVK